ncbi:PTS lactose/cellobiose transporter subunit IIA [Pradoshia sp.]
MQGEKELIKALYLCGEDCSSTAIEAFAAANAGEIELAQKKLKEADDSYNYGRAIQLSIIKDSESKGNREKVLAENYLLLAMNMNNMVREYVKSL